MPSEGHQKIDEPAAWVRRWSGRIAAGGRVLDLASGSGRHARYLAGRGHTVEAVDRDADALHELDGVAGVTTRACDLESGEWPYPGAKFDAVIVTNYLHRPLFRYLIAAVGPGGVLIYETFALGNERFGRPRNPDFLLRPGELLQATHGLLEVIAYENCIVDEPRRAAIQRVCAINLASR